MTPMEQLRCEAYMTLCSIIKGQALLRETLPFGAKVKVYGEWTGTVAMYSEPFSGHVCIKPDRGMEQKFGQDRYGNVSVHVDHLEKLP